MVGKGVKRRGRGLHCNIKNDGCRDWAGLPEDLLELILSLLHLPDRISFSKVCRSWGKFYRQGGWYVKCNRVEGRIPWLMMLGWNRSTIRRGYSIMEDVCYQLKDEYLCWGALWGTFQDWLILLCNYTKYMVRDICLLNPFTKQRVFLPTVTGFFTKLLLSTSPCDENCVFMVVGPWPAFWVHGAEKWRYVTVLGAPYSEGVFAQGCFYMPNRQCYVAVIDAENVLTAMRAKDTHIEIRTKILPIKFLDERLPFKWVWYMVQSCNDILFVHQYFNSQCVTEHINVYRLDVFQQVWVKVKSLGDQVLFIGRNSSASYSTKELGTGMANCIFFPYNHTHLVFPMDPEYEIASGTKIDEWGIFDLDKQHVSNFASRPSHRMVGGMWLGAPAWWYNTTSRSMAMTRQPQMHYGRVKMDIMPQQQQQN